ncbi:MAG TPA: T9SS type A sorting domain-containing protein, partial [Paludibacter sp.]|nr:T9SS type A sorting domain-containing protein [Paludibacter sp.]
AAYLVDKQFNVKTVNNIGILTDTEYDQTNNTYWFAASALGVISYKQNGSEEPILSYFKPAGPAVNIPWDMTFAGKKLFVVPGGRWSDRYSRDAAVMMYENGKWTNIYKKEIQDSTKYQALDFMNVAVDPADDKHFFVTSYGTGLYEFRNNIFSKWYNNTNSSLETIIQSDPFNYIRLDGAIFDQQRNLFIANSTVASGIKVLLANGTWTKLTFPGVAIKATLGKIMISNQNPNQKWIPSVRYTPGICVWDDNGTITDQSDDKSVFIQSMIFPEVDNNGKTVLTTVNPSIVYTTAQDRNGIVWVGTDQGPFLFQNLSKVYNSDYTCSRVKIPRNDSTNLADYLLVNEKIKAIAIDGANRKWIGTEASGVYLMSENGQQTIQHFTVSNSPLLSNDIISISINPVTGEVFFGTGQGIVSYQSDASEAGNTFSNVYAYPNPVREGFTGIITITGLVENTQVKITDISGNLVCQTVSNGSIATWDGKDAHGRKVSTGIYLALCTSSDGTQSSITKIMVIN